MADATSPTRQLIPIAAAAAIYVVAGRLALWMAIPPGYATAVWPAAGLALICVLRWGRRAAIGVALGSFAINIATGFDTSSTLAVVRSCGITAAIGSAAALQAVIGAALIRRRIGFPSPLHDERDLVWFVVLGGPVACLVCATISVSILSLGGAVAWSSFAFNWWTWWVGDTIGVLVFAPLALLVLPGAHPVWRRRRGIVGVPLVLGFAAVTALFLRVSGWEQARLHREFERRVVPIEAVLRSQLSNYEEVVSSLASFFDASNEVTRDEFHTYCARALAKYPALTALSWNPETSAARRDALEGAARADGFTEFHVTELGPDGRLSPAGDRPVYAPVFYVEPPSEGAVLGFDTYSDPLRHAAFDRASRFGSMAATQRIHLIQDRNGGPASDGVLLVAPTHDRTAGHPVLGFAVGVFRLRGVVDTALDGIDHEGMSVRLLDPGAGDVLYRTDAPASADTSAREVSMIEFGDRRWRLEIAPTAAFVAGQRSWQAWSVLASGLLFVGLLGIVLLITTGRAFRVHEGAERFRALVEASAQLVWTTDASGAVSEDSPSWRAFTGQTYDQWRGWGRLDAIHPDDTRGVHDRWREVITARKVVEGEYRVRHATGEWRWMIGRAVPLADAQGELRGWVCSAVDNSERKRAEAERESFLAELRRLNADLEQRVAERTDELTCALREREVLLQEVHHRVKNNLQVISSLINLQVRKLADEGDRAALEECQTRIQAIALIHDQLYQSRDYANVPFSAYTRQLVNNVFRTMGISPDRIQLALAIDDVAVPVDKAIPCGLLLNELITNALKHAFKDGRAGTIRVELTRRDDKIRMVVADDGVGLPIDLGARSTSSLGLRLVHTLVRQLRATLEVSTDDGTRFELEFAA
jgi:PAS domain S-box-containing protein